MIRNLAWSSMSFFLRLFSNVIIFFLIAREFGPEKFGHFSTLVLYGTVLALFSDLGTHQRLYKEISINGDNDKLIYALKLIFMTATVLLSVALSIIYSSPEVLFVILSYIINTYIDFIQIRLRACGQFKKEAYSSFINNTVFFVLVGATLLYSHDVFILSLSFLISRVLSVMVMNYLLRMDTIKVWLDSSLRLKSRWENRKENNKEAQIYYSFDFLLTNLWTVIDGVVIKSFFSTFTFGLYTSYSKIINGVSTLSVIFTNVIFKGIAHEAVLRKNRKLVLGTSVLFLTGFVIITFLYFAKDILVGKILGENYALYAKYLPYMFIPIWLKWISSCLGIYLLGAGGVRKRVVAQVVALMVFVLTFSVIKSFGHSISAVIASLSAAYIIIMLFYFKHFLDYKNEN